MRPIGFAIIGYRRYRLYKCFPYSNIYKGNTDLKLMKTVEKAMELEDI